MADLGVLGKFVITRLYGHFWSRSLEQTLHVDSDQPRGCFRAISLQTCDAHQARLISNQAG